MLYPLAPSLSRPLQDFGDLKGPWPAPTLILIGAVALLFALYGAALRACSHLEASPAALVTVYGLGAVSAVVLLPMYPIFSLDIFYYMAADRIWSVFRENPFIVPPLQAAHDPFFPYTPWGHYPLPYGPLWPWITAATSSFGGGQVPATLVAFKALGVLAYLACLPAVTWALTGLQPERRLMGSCAFAWNPLVLLELAGAAHNDGVALVPAAIGLGLWARRASATAALSLALSFLIKGTVVVLVPGLLWASLQRSVAQRRWRRWLGTHALPAMALIVLAWTPFWRDGGLYGPLREGGQYYQSLTGLVAAVLPASWGTPALRGVQLGLLISFALVYWAQRRSLAEEGSTALHTLWCLSVLYFLVISPFFSAWYLLWPTLLAAVLAQGRILLLTSLLCLGGLGTYGVQFVLRPALALGWTEANALGLLVALVPFLVGWALTTARPRRTAAFSVRAVVRPLPEAMQAGGTAKPIGERT